MDAEDDADVQVEVEDEDATEMHPKILTNAAPVFFIQYYQTGWHIIAHSKLKSISNLKLCKK